MSNDIGTDPYWVGRAIGQIAHEMQRVEAEMVRGFLDGFSASEQGGDVVTWEDLDATKEDA